MNLERNKNMNVSPATSAVQTLLPPSQTVQAADNQITINVTNNEKLGSDVVSVSNLFALEVDGSNNNITINETNNISTESPSVTPTVNPDGTVTFGSLDDLNNFIQNELAKLLAPDLGKAVKAYQTANNLSPTVNLSA